MKLKAFITSCLLFILSASFAQTWENWGNPSLQRLLTPAGYMSRFNAGAKGFYSPLPLGLKGQLLKGAADNSTVYTAQEPVVYGQFIYTDAQLAIAEAAGTATQFQIFKTFKRFAHGGNVGNPTGPIVPSNTIPQLPLQTNSYLYDTTSNLVFSTINASSHIGLVSPEKYRGYTHKVTLTATGIGSPTDFDHGYDNDIVGLVIAFVEDSTHMVTNNAHGLSPDSFTWPIDVTSTTIPDQHTLTLIRQRNGATLSYAIYYDYGKVGQTVIADGSSLVNNTTANWQGAEVDVEVDLSGDTVVTKTTNFSDLSGGKGALAHPLTVLLTSNPLLAKFRNGVSYGYSTNSQANASFKNINFSGSNNLIYDLRDGTTYKFVGSAYVIDATKNMYTDLGKRFFWRDTLQQTYGYIPPTVANIYDVIVAPASHTNLYGSASLNFPSTAAGAQSSLTIAVTGAVVGSPVSVGVPLSILPGGANYQFNGVVSGAGTVSVVYQNLSGSTVDPNVGLFKVTVFQ